MTVEVLVDLPHFIRSKVVVGQVSLVLLGRDLAVLVLSQLGPVH